MKNCFLFPGQGAQYPGMGKDLWESSGKVKELFDTASEVVKMNLKDLLFKGSEEELKATDKTQVTVTLVNLAAGIALKERGIEASGCAGFSLGEYSALHEAGVIGLEELFSIVKSRGELMEKASRNLDARAGAGGGRAGMAAVLGLPYEEAVEVLEKLAGEDVYLANHSSPIQIVLSGSSEGLKKARALFEEAGALRYVPLKVSGPFHSPLLEEARIGLKDLLSGFTFKDPARPVYANTSGEAIQSGEEARELCIRQVVSTVLWVKEEESILADDYDRFLEVGPGSVLSGLWKSFTKKIRCRPAGKLENIELLAAE